MANAAYTRVTASRGRLKVVSGAIPSANCQSAYWKKFAS
jgi:uncharacterized protein YaiE (UPF0345 family)